MRFQPFGRYRDPAPRESVRTHCRKIRTVVIVVRGSMAEERTTAREGGGRRRRAAQPWAWVPRDGGGCR